MSTHYLRKVDHPTSVKEINLIREPSLTYQGTADFTAKPVFSVFDYGTFHPPVPLDNSTITLMAGFNFELLKAHGIQSHYMRLMTDEGDGIAAKDAIAAGITPSTMRVMYVNRHVPEFKDGAWDYSMFRGNGDPQRPLAYVHPLEFITRNELPESSSVWKRVARGDVTLADFGLPDSFNKGDAVPDTLQPLLDYSTKFEPDDRYVSPQQAQEMLGVNSDRFGKIANIVKNASTLMTEYAASRDFARLDGKVELITFIGSEGRVRDMLGDAVCTWHEDRLEYAGMPISKQLIRDEVKKHNPRWYDEITRAKQQAVDEGHEDFRTLMNPAITYTSPNPEFFTALNALFQAATNQWVAKPVYSVSPNKGNSLKDDLEKAIEGFNKTARRR